jgi:hypothetical protein
MDPLNNILAASLAIAREQIESAHRTTNLATIVLVASGYESFFYAPLQTLPEILRADAPRHAAKMNAHIVAVSRLDHRTGHLLIDVVTWAGHATFRAPIISIAGAPMVGPAEPRSYDAMPYLAGLCANLKPLPTEIAA